MITLYRGVEQLVARRAHNPKVAWFKSRPRNQIEKEQSAKTVLFLFRYESVEPRDRGFPRRKLRARPVDEEARIFLRSGQNF